MKAGRFACLGLGRHELPSVGMGEEIETEHAVERVTGLLAPVRPEAGDPEQGKVADRVEDLVADELVGSPQAAGVEHALLAENRRVLERPAAGEAVLAQLLDLPGETEGAREGDLTA